MNDEAEDRGVLGAGELDLRDLAGVAGREAELLRGLQQPGLLIADGVRLAGVGRKLDDFGEQRDELLRLDAIVVTVDFLHVRCEGRGEKERDGDDHEGSFRSSESRACFSGNPPP